MRTGAVAFLDILGFKGIWEAYSPQDVLEKLKAVEDWVKPWSAESPFDPDVDCDIRSVFLSDAVVLACAAKSARGESERTRNSLHLASMLTVIRGAAAVAAKMALKDPAPQLLLRGAVAWGEFLIDPPFIVGPAVDEAAEGEGDLNAALVEALPSLLAAYDSISSMDILTGTDSVIGGIEGHLLKKVCLPHKKKPSGEGVVIPPMADPLTYLEELESIFFRTKEDRERSHLVRKFGYTKDVVEEWVKRR